MREVNTDARGRLKEEWRRLWKRMIHTGGNICE